MLTYLCCIISVGGCTYVQNRAVRIVKLRPKIVVQTSTVLCCYSRRQNPLPQLLVQPVELSLQHARDTLCLCVTIVCCSHRRGVLQGSCREAATARAVYTQSLPYSRYSFVLYSTGIYLSTQDNFIKGNPVVIPETSQRL